MARIRYIKPSFFTSDEVAELPPLIRLLFAGIWCLADREGFLEDRPKRIKAEVMPHDRIDVVKAIDLLELRGFVHRYEVDGVGLIHVTNFLVHQKPHHREPPSTLHPCPVHGTSITHATTEWESSRARNVKGNGEGKGDGDRNGDASMTPPTTRESPEWQRAIRAWDAQSPGSINPIILQQLDDWLADGIPIDWIEEACKRAGLQGGRKGAAYLGTMFTQWRKDGFGFDSRPQKGAQRQPSEPDYSRGVNTGAGLVVKTLEQEYAEERARKKQEAG